MSADAKDARDVLAQRVRDVLAGRGELREVRMFGGLSFMVRGRMAVAAGRDGDLLVRADPRAYDDLIARGAKQAYMGTDRPMGRGWLQVPRHLLEADDELATWVQVGLDSAGATG